MQNNTIDNFSRNSNNLTFDVHFAPLPLLPSSKMHCLSNSDGNNKSNQAMMATRAAVDHRPHGDNKCSTNSSNSTRKRLPLQPLLRLLPLLNLTFDVQFALLSPLPISKMHCLSDISDNINNNQAMMTTRTAADLHLHSHNRCSISNNNSRRKRTLLQQLLSVLLPPLLPKRQYSTAAADDEEASNSYNHHHQIHYTLPNKAAMTRSSHTNKPPYDCQRNA